MDEQKNEPDLKETQTEEPQGDKKFNSSRNNNLPRISPITIALIGLFGGFFLYQIIGGLLTLLVFGFNINNASVNGLRLMTIAGQILFILLPALIFSKVFYEDVGHIIRFKFPKWEEFFLFTIGIIVLTPLIQYYLSIQNYFIDLWSVNSSIIKTIKTFLDKINDVVDKTYGNLLSAKTILDVILVVIVVSVVPAICEETMFRGFIQKSFEFKIKPFWAALITAIFFGLYHFNPYGLIPLIALGFYFGFAAYTSNSIFIPVLLHFLNNFFAIIFYFIYGNDDVLNSAITKNFDLYSSVLILLGLTALFSVIIFFIKRYYSRTNNS
ncbi:MAG: CPBP family intramembrane metalloprotease [Bacteroidetes bacterium]|nr:CPBP family intramembrane metalloprotease [Bacteroidota bacterium]